jgi:hypothetical protein
MPTETVVSYLRRLASVNHVPVWWLLDHLTDPGSSA